MRILIETPVAQDYKTVWAGFNEDLFLALKPIFPPLKLLRFDGSMAGDEVHVQIFNQRFDALIVEQAELEGEIYFIDEGKQLPFPLKKWRHRHRMIQQAKGSLIIDDIQFSTGFVLLDYLVYPGLYLQFAGRKPVYQKIFGKQVS